MSASTLPLASRERSHAWHSPVRLWGWEQVTSAGGLGHSPLCLATSDRISSSPGMQRAMGEVHDDGGGGGLCSALLLQPRARMHDPAHSSQGQRYGCE